MSLLTLGDIFCCDINDMEFKKKYDCIWIQWGLCWIQSDKKLAEFLERVRSALKTASESERKDNTGLLIVKENSEPKYTNDKSTYGKTRTVKKWEKIFEVAGFEILYN